MRRALLLAGLAAALSVPSVALAQIDAGPPDAGARDAGRRATPRRRPDAGPPPAAPDAGVEPPRAAAQLDAGVPVAADAGDALLALLPDGSLPDAGPPDAGPPDAGLPDGGPPDAGPVAEAPEPWWIPDQLAELVLGNEEARRAADDARRAADEARRASTGGSPNVTVTNETPPEVSVRVSGCDAGPALLGLTLPETVASTGQLLALLVLALLAIGASARLRRPLPERGVIPRALGTIHLFARIAAVALVLMIATRWLPGWLRPALLMTVAAAAIAIGFGVVWVVLPDVVSGVLLVTEARVRRGLWITGEGFEGTVERVGPRVTVLMDAEGHRLTVPNRKLVRSAIHAIDRRWPELQLSLRVPTSRPASQVRRAVEDAVLCSPHLPPDPRMSVARDAEDPQLWRIHVRLLEVTHREAFEGQLLERIEEALEVPVSSTPPPKADPPSPG